MMMPMMIMVMIMVMVMIMFGDYDGDYDDDSDEYYKQNVGTTMGSRPAPPFANNFMAKIDTKIWDISEKLKKGRKSSNELSIQIFG